MLRRVRVSSSRARSTRRRSSHRCGSTPAVAMKTAPPDLSNCHHSVSAKRSCTVTTTLGCDIAAGNAGSAGRCAEGLRRRHRGSTSRIRAPPRPRRRDLSARPQTAAQRCLVHRGVAPPPGKTCGRPTKADSWLRQPGSAVVDGDAAGAAGAGAIGSAGAGLGKGVGRGAAGRVRATGRGCGRGGSGKGVGCRFCGGSSDADPGAGRACASRDRRPPPGRLSAPPHASRRPRERSGRRNRLSNDEARREGGCGIVPARIIPFDGMRTVPLASMADEHHPEGGG